MIFISDTRNLSLVVVAVVISVLVFSASISILRELYDSLVIGAVILVVCVLITGLLYCKYTQPYDTTEISAGVFWVGKTRSP